jgi:hypothetical protein
MRVGLIAVQTSDIAVAVDLSKYLEQNYEHMDRMREYGTHTDVGTVKSQLNLTQLDCGLFTP